jgi:hypothetical protein
VTPAGPGSTEVGQSIETALGICIGMLLRRQAQQLAQGDRRPAPYVRHGGGREAVKKAPAER